MSNVVKKLYDGRYYPIETAFPQDIDFKSLRTMIERKWNYFSEILPESEQDNFESLHMMIVEMEDKINFAFFSEGLKLGLSLMGETCNYLE